MSNNLVITTAGYAELVNAEATGTDAVVLSHIAVGSGQYTATADMTALKSEIKRSAAISGGAVGDNVIHLLYEDNSSDVYTAYEVGVFTSTGTLFAVYSQNTALIPKAASSIGMLAIDIVFDEMAPANITVGNTNFVVNPATTENKGVIEIATEAEAKAATDKERAIVPATLQAVIQNHINIVHRSGNETITGKKTFNSSITINNNLPEIHLKNLEVVRGEQPEENKSIGISFEDAEQTMIGRVYGLYSTDKTTQISLYAYKPQPVEDGQYVYDGISVVYPASGNPYATAPTPAKGDNSTKIATTEWVNVKAKEYLPLAGGTMTGTISKNGGTFLNNTNSTSSLVLTGDKLSHNASVLMLFGLEHPDFPGGFIVRAGNNTNSYTLLGKADGSLIWGGKNIVRSVDGITANAAGNVTLNALPKSGGAMTTTKAMTRDVNNSYISIYGGTGENNDGAHLDLCGANHPTMPSAFQIHARNLSTDKILRGQIDGTLTWDSKTVLTNSTSMPTDASGIVLNGGRDYEKGAYIRVYGKDHNTYPGWFTLGASDGTNTSALRGLPDGTLTWNGRDVVCVEAWRASDGSRWYRKYADGWVVQGGYTEPTTALPYNRTVVLPVEMADTNYIPLIAINGEGTLNTGSAGVSYFAVANITETSFDVYQSNVAGLRSKYWRVEGYAATE